MAMLNYRRGCVRLSLDVLRDALGLPRDTYVHGVAVTPDDLFSNTVTLAVSGPGLPEVAEGDRAPDLLVRLQRHSNGRVTVHSIEPAKDRAAAPPIAEVSDAPILWLVGQIKFADDGDADPSSWELQGVFSDRAKAIQACRTEAYFVSPLELNAPLPDETMSVEETTKASFFPLVDDPSRLESLSVLGGGTD